MGSYSEIPPFPDDVLTAPLFELSLKKLTSGDPSEVAQLFAAAKDTGFFYLNLDDTPRGRSMLSNAEDLFGIAEPVFDEENEAKNTLYFRKNMTSTGYTKKDSAIVDEKGNKSWAEFYNLLKDDILSSDKDLPFPKSIQDNRQLLQTFTRSSHAILTVILNSLNESLGLPPSTLADMHRVSPESKSMARFIKYEASTAEEAKRIAAPAHRDAGSITLLFNRLGGLQILPPGRDTEWKYVRPLPGHAIVNLGDAMVTFTNGLFRSNPHRVVAPPGQQAGHTKISLVYFMRPENEVIMQRLKGSELIPDLDGESEEQGMTAEEWVAHRFAAIRDGKGMKTVSSTR